MKSFVELYTNYRRLQIQEHTDKNGKYTGKSPIHMDKTFVGIGILFWLINIFTTFLMPNGILKISTLFFSSMVGTYSFITSIPRLIVDHRLLRKLK